MIALGLDLRSVELVERPAGVTDFGKMMSPRSMCQRSTTWAGLLPAPLAIETIVGSSRTMPCAIGDQASIAI